MAIQQPAGNKATASDRPGKMRDLCRHIEAHVAARGDEPLNLVALGRHAGVSPHHLQRTFKAVIGVTPREYAEACRLKLLKAGLREAPSVTQAIHDAGFGSSSRVYERAGSHLGMTPKQYRQGGVGMAISWAVADTPLGLLMMAATDRGLCSVQIGDDQASLAEQLAREFPGAAITSMNTRHGKKNAGQFAAWMRALKDHLSSVSLRLDLPLDIHGTAFQMKVWRYLMRIPAGEVRSYSEVAHAIGKPSAVRAVASACARNRIAIVIPCHRVIRGDGSMGGYRWGLDRKRRLIAQERAAGAGDRKPQAAQTPRTRS